MRASVQLSSSIVDVCRFDRLFLIAEQDVDIACLVPDGDGQYGFQFAIVADVHGIKLHLGDTVLVCRERLFKRVLVVHQDTLSAHAPSYVLGTDGVADDFQFCGARLLFAVLGLDNETVLWISRRICLTVHLAKAIVILFS